VAGGLIAERARLPQSSVGAASGRDGR